MKYLIENAAELVKTACRLRHEGDNSPTLPEDALLSFNDNFDLVSLQAEGFALGPEVTTESILKVFGAKLDIKVAVHHGTLTRD